MTLNGPFPPGLHYICPTAEFAANESVLSVYRDTTQGPLPHVYAGDDPAAPTMTVALTFPDQTTLEAVLAALS